MLPGVILARYLRYWTEITFTRDAPGTGIVFVG